MDKELPKRKSPRLKYFDYSSEGAYFVTICVNNKMHILSEIQNITATGTNHIMVGEGLVSRETWFTICEDTWFTTYTTNKFGAKA